MAFEADVPRPRAPQCLSIGLPCAHAIAKAPAPHAEANQNGSRNTLSFATRKAPSKQDNPASEDRAHASKEIEFTIRKTVYKRLDFIAAHIHT
jgi:hypothetical protein